MQFPHQLPIGDDEKPSLMDCPECIIPTVHDNNKEYDAPKTSMLCLQCPIHSSLGAVSATLPLGYRNSEKGGRCQANNTGRAYFMANVECRQPALQLYSMVAFWISHIMLEKSGCQERESESLVTYVPIAARSDNFFYLQESFLFEFVGTKQLGA